MNFEGFTGGSQTGYSRTVNAERTINLYVEVPSGEPKRKPVMYNRPSLMAWTYTAPGPVRALFHQDNRMFCVSGRFFYEILQSRNLANGNAPWGEMESDGNPATISSNGTGGEQLFITSGGAGYIFDLSDNTFTEITDEEFLRPSAMGLFSDSSFINLQRGTNSWQISDLKDGLSWNGLLTGTVSTSSDKTLAIAMLARQLWLMGSKTSQPWQAVSGGNNPYAPIPGVFIEHGIIAPYSIQLLDNTLYWLGQDTQGRAIVWRANGYTPERISTHALEYQLQNLARLNDIIGFSFQFNGHGMYALYSPLLETTWVYNVNNNLWVEWSHWDEVYLRDQPLAARCACAGWNKVFLGDRQSGAIYTLEDDVFEDDVVWNG